MPKMSDEQAAAAIREKLSKKHPSASMTPEDRHFLAFTKRVCGLLGRDPDFQSVSEVGSLLKEQDITDANYGEYPKVLTNDEGQPICNSAGVALIADTPEHEAELKADGQVILPVDAYDVHPSDSTRDVRYVPKTEYTGTGETAAPNQPERSEPIPSTPAPKPSPSPIRPIV